VLGSHGASLVKTSHLHVSISSIVGVRVGMLEKHPLRLKGIVKFSSSGKIMECNNVPS
jgi:hypothetical protein